MTGTLELPPRAGLKPLTTRTNPHEQLNQHPPPALFDALAQRCFALPHVIERPSLISVRGARALTLEPGIALGPRVAFLIDREFAHIHPFPDGSMHLALPAPAARAVIERGWGELHPASALGLIPAGIVMVYAPRAPNELEIAMHIVEASYRFALGQVELLA